MSPPDPLYCTLFLLSAFCLAGAAQTWWLRTPRSRPFAIPLDGGLTFRGRRLFGENKTWKGFVIMVPAVGTAFWLLSMLCPALGISGTAAVWPLSGGQFFLLGCWTGLAFMLGELPNSFVKRQLGILPGAPPTQPLARAACFLIDQSDSVLGALVALALLVPVPWLTWILILAAGPVVHWLFNVVLMLLGVKAKAA